MSELARTYTPDAIKALVLALHWPATRVPAAIALLDRGWGRPEVHIHAQSEQTVLHLLAAQAISEELHLSIQTPVDTQPAEPAKLVDMSEQPKE